LRRVLEGATIGQYRVIGQIGRGGMGAVYAAEHTLLGRPAAIKLLLPELSQNQDVVMRFFNEARAATAVRHPGIVEIYDFGWTPEGAAFIVMERLEGETLAQRASRVRLSWPVALAIGRQIAGALGAAHIKGIVHRDLKPDNVFLVPDPEVPGGERIKLLDFGIAKLAESGAANMTQAGVVIGTPSYMAPEQCRGVSVDHRADLYSLGCVLYELCSGRPPFVGEGAGDVLAAHIHLAVPAMPRVAAVSEIPAVVEDLIVNRLLAKSPVVRVQSAEELIRAIDAVSGPRTGATTGSSSIPPVAFTSPKTTLSGSATTRMSTSPRSKRARWPLAAFALAMAAISASVVAVVMRGGESDSPVPGATTLPSASAQPSSAQPSPAQPSSAQPSSAQPSSAQPSSAQPSSAQPSSAQPSSAQPSSAQPSSAQPSPAQPSSAQAVTAQAVTAQAVTAVPGVPAPAAHPAGAIAPPVASAPPAPTAHTPVASPAAALVNRPAARGVAIDSTPSGAQVILDGVVLGITPFHGPLPNRDRDAHLIVRLAGYADRIILVSRSSAPIETVALVRIAPPPPARKATDDRNKSINPF
jgi:serine/threonine-protein kinase